MKQEESQALNMQIKKRIDELHSLLGQEAANNAAYDEPSDSAEQKMNSSVERQITAKEKQELARLQANLRWLESDEGGCCERCGSEIPFARLRAVPATRLCINCAK